jgi:hypothetical protein
MKFALTLIFLVLSFSTWSKSKLSDAIPYPYYVNQDDSQNKVMSVTDGMAALQLRLEMTRRAKESGFITMARRLIVRDKLRVSLARMRKTCFS